MITADKIKSHLLAKIRQNLTNTGLIGTYNQIYFGNPQMEGCRSKILRGAIVPHVLVDKKCHGISLFCQVEPRTNDQIKSFAHVLQKEDPSLYVFPSLFLSVLYLRPSFTANFVDRRYKDNIVYRKKRIFYPTSEPEKPMLREANYDQFIRVIKETLKGVNPFEIDLKGVCASNSSIFVQGFDHGATNSLRIRLIEAFENAGLWISEWQPEIVNITFARYQPAVTDVSDDRRKLIEIIDGSRDIDFGYLLVRRIQLIEEKRAYMEDYSEKGHFVLPSGEWITNEK